MGDAATQERMKWAAVSLAYAGADESHIEVALPCLERHGLKGTFFVEPVAMLARGADWRGVSNQGHEIGCGSLIGDHDGQGNLPHWTLEMVEAELRDNRRLLTETFDRQADFAFLFPGVETNCLSVPYNPQPVSYRRVVEHTFNVAVSGDQGTNEALRGDLGYLRRIDAEDLREQDLIEVVESACATGAWAILVFGGIGVGHIGLDAGAHEKLCRHISQLPDSVEPSTVLRTAYRLRSAREAQSPGTLLREG